jgi:hypothetical protein
MKIVVTFHVDDLGVAARNYHGEKWKFWFVTTEPVGINMRFEVVGWIEGDII